MQAAASNPAAGRYPIAVAAIALLIAGVFMPTPLYELYHREWGLTSGQISIVFAIYAASLIPSLLFLGGISDGIGRRKTLLIAIAIAALGSLAFAFASGLWWLIAARALQGVALGIGLPTAVAAVREWMDDAMRSRAGTLAIVGTSVGSAFGALARRRFSRIRAAPEHAGISRVPRVARGTCRCGRERTLVPAPRAGLTSGTFRRFRAQSGGRSSSPPVSRSSVGPRLAIFVSLLPSFLAQGLGVHNLLLGGIVVADMHVRHARRLADRSRLEQSRRDHPCDALPRRRLLDLAVGRAASRCMR